jgi:hypothetical protein
MLSAASRLLTDRNVAIGAALRRGVVRCLPLLGTIILTCLAIFIGLIALIIPAFIVFIRFQVAPAACVIEGLSPSASISRSLVLTKGHGWKIFGIMLPVIGTAVVISIVPSMMLPHLTGAPVADIVASGASLVAGAFVQGLFVVLYDELRTANEGFGGDRLVAVFD